MTENELVASAGEALFDPEAVAKFGEVDYAIYSSIMHSGSALARMQVRDVARDAHVSPASVVRFCKKCGCTGFPELKERFLLMLQRGTADVQVDELDALEDFVEYAHSESFNHAIDAAYELLRDAKLILLVGIGVSSHMAAAGARIFLNSGAFALSVSDPFAPIVNVPTEGTVAIALSFSGTTPQVVAMSSDLVREGSKLVSITNAAESPLAALSDVAIAYHVPDIPITGNLNLGSQIPVLYVLERLARMIYEYKGARVRDSYR